MQPLEMHPACFMQVTSKAHCYGGNISQPTVHVACLMQLIPQDSLKNQATVLFLFLFFAQLR